MSSTIQPSDVAVSYVDESLQQRDSVLVDGCDGESDECSGDDDDDEHNEYGNGSQVGVETDDLIDKRPLFTALTLAGDNENTIFPRKGSSGGGGGKSSGGKTKGKVGTGIWNESRGRPKVTKKKDKADGTGKEDVNLSNCIKDLPIVLSTCYINGDRGTIYADRMDESIYTMANATNRWDRGWAHEKVTDIMEEITEAGCNLEPKCRDHMNRWIHYFRNPTDMPELTVRWNQFAIDGTLPDDRISKKDRKGAQKAGRKFGNAAYSLASLNCTIGDQPASIFVELTQDQLAEIDGDFFNRTDAIHEFTESINLADKSSCPGWKGKQDFVGTARQALDRAESLNRGQVMRARYFAESANTQMERRESLAPGSIASGSVVLTAAALTALLSHMGMV